MIFNGYPPAKGTFEVFYNIFGDTVGLHCYIVFVLPIYRDYIRVTMHLVFYCGQAICTWVFLLYIGKTHTGAKEGSQWGRTTYSPTGNQTQKP